MDLCFVPATHEVTIKLPAVSGSSGRLIVERAAAETPERTWPGQVFENPELSYEEAMRDFVTASQQEAKPALQPQEGVAEASLKARKRALRGEEAQLRAARRSVREKRRLEDAAWKQARVEREIAAAAYQALSKPERRQQRRVKQARDAVWRAVRTQRRATVKQRQHEDEIWRQHRLAFRQRWSELPVITAWIAILVIVDNSTRQCLGLPVFVAGARVTSEMLIDALRVLLPPELHFLISDRGTHFTAKAFQTFVLSEDFVHVRIARHRPQSNGIAERFVRTLKEWLANHAWQSAETLTALLQSFVAEYNERPHQGLPLPGLSPNEFARRVWLF